jgi:dTMP kinase
MYVILEGIDGSGTSTQIKLLKEQLEKKNISCAITCEPTYSEIGSLVRKYLKKEDANEYTHALLFAADRLEHEQFVSKLEEDYSIVISDRGIGSSIAYQSQTCGIDFTLSINQQARGPDLVILLSLPVETALSRISDRKEFDRFEKSEFLKKVSLEYESLSEFLDCVHIVNSDAAIEDVTDECIKIILNKFLELQ